MKRRDLIKLTGAAMTFSAMPSIVQSANSQKSPGKLSGNSRNLLFLFTDQQRQDTLSVYGNHQIKVPNLNRLASQSVVFHNCYCTQPICTPSRGTLLTGLWPHSHGEYTNNVPLPADIPVLVQMLSKGKYRTGYFGKWHLGNEIFRQHGFDEFESTEDGYSSYYLNAAQEEKDQHRNHSGYYRFLVSKGVKPDGESTFSRELSNSLPEELSKAAYLAKVASEFLQDNSGRPWVMYVNFLDPHTPFKSALNDMYDPRMIDVPASFDTAPGVSELDQTKAYRDAIENKTTPLDDGMPANELELREMKARYWGKISLVDTMIGRILRKLEETHQVDNTIIVFTTDHGEMMGEHHLMYKSVMYEGATKVPMLMKIPGLDSPMAIERPVSDINVVPTLLDLLGEQVPAHLQGTSWAPYLMSGAEPINEAVIIEWNGSPDGPPEFIEETQNGKSEKVIKASDRWKLKNSKPLRTIRTQSGWKMTLAPDGAGELYFLAEDPNEMHNRFYDDTSLDRITSLSAEINLWQRATGDTIIPFDESKWSERKKLLALQGGI